MVSSVAAVTLASIPAVAAAKAVPDVPSVPRSTVKVSVDLLVILMISTSPVVLSNIVAI